MKRLATLAALLCSAWAWGAAGDITSVTVLATGWEAEIVIEGRTPPVTAYVGYGDPNMQTPPTHVKLNVTSPGYTTAGAATTVSRTVYATRTQRQLDPNEANLWEEASGGTNLLIRVALSDYIYSADTVTATIPASWVTTAGGASNAYSGAVTNNSTLGYPQVHCQWAWPDLERWGAADLAAGYDIEVVAVDHWAAQRKLAQCVKFTLTGATSSATLSSTVTTATLSSRTYPYGATVPQATVYKYTVTGAALAAAGFSDNEIVVVSASAYPRIGESAAVATSSPSSDPNTTLFCDQRFVYDPDDDYGAAYALVSPTGNDGTGAVAATEPAAINAYATIQAAAVAIKTYNNAQYSRNNPGNGVILLAAGSYPWTGLTSAPGDMGAQDVWLTVRGTATDPNDVQITTNTTNRYLDARRLKLENLTVAPSTPGTTLIWGRNVTAPQWIWLDRVQVDQGGNATPPVPYQYTNVFATRCYYPDGAYLYYWSTVNSGVRLTRNCFLDHGTASGSGGVMPYCCVANTARKVLLQPPPDTNASPHSDGGIVAWNAFYRIQSSFVSGGTIPTATRAYNIGLSLIGNILEKTTSTNPVLELAANSQLVACNGVRLLCNTCCGERVNLAYSASSGANLRTGWRNIGNATDDWNTKHDAFAGDPNMIGGKSFEYGTGHACNRRASATFPAIYQGRYESTTSLSAAYAAYRAYPDPNGLGDYTPTPLSPLMGALLPGMAPMPYDLWGTPLRDDGTDAAGAVQRPSATTCYVAAAGGSDTTSGGRGLSADLPWATWSYAYDNAPSGSTISAAGGTYNTGTAAGLIIDGNKSLTFAGAGETATLLSPATYTGPTIYVANGNYSGTVTLRDVGIVHPASAAATRAIGQTLSSTAQVSFVLEDVALTLPASYTANYAIEISSGSSPWHRTFTWDGGTVTCGAASNAALVYAKAASVVLKTLTLPATTTTLRNLMTVATPTPSITVSGVTGTVGAQAINSSGSAITCNSLYAINNVMTCGAFMTPADPNHGGFIRWGASSEPNMPAQFVIADNTLTTHGDAIYLVDNTGTGGGTGIVVGNTIHGTSHDSTTTHGIGPFDRIDEALIAHNAVYLTGASTYGIVAKGDNTSVIGNVVDAFCPFTLAGGASPDGTDPNDQTGCSILHNTGRVNSANGRAIQIEKYNGTTTAWPVHYRVMDNIFDAAGVSGAYALEIESQSGTPPAEFWNGIVDRNTYVAGATNLAKLGSVTVTASEGLAGLQAAWTTIEGRAWNDLHSTVAASATFPSTETGATLQTKHPAGAIPVGGGGRKQLGGTGAVR